MGLDTEVSAFVRVAIAEMGGSEEAETGTRAESEMHMHNTHAIRVDLQSDVGRQASREIVLC